ncbi:MAG: prephenate dehydrogenase/arogenate dehydrogenase family protein, partial [Nocardiopsaceae bacterium]|nr:prephenate dehydrogenase/arogenate dehydrogenase family protein [Nocardiopsaceae bacterium]
MVIGTGLIGTSVALALRARGASVWLSDIDPGSAVLAAGLGAGTVVDDLRDARDVADVAVLAMPPDAVGPMLARSQDAAVARVYTDVASVKALPAARAREMGCDLDSYVPGHPLAGRERHGPAAARPDLFLGRTWALCPLPETSPSAVAEASALARACGAEVVVTDPATHDRWVALVSHAPHVVSSAMAARLAAGPVPGDPVSGDSVSGDPVPGDAASRGAAPGNAVSGDALRLAGQGLRDVTRIAAGDPALWTQILSANAGPVAEVLAAVANDLAAASEALAAAASGSPAASGPVSPASVPGSSVSPASVPGS